ncbi:MAG: nitroreductase family protein [Deltaproteobacteria bacterium]|nr:nitroreductase family protein [Deltaproteobacteria bacterium]MBW2533268.1 nitroreductase family protein [Deltaproteobacteria bacterium]
MSDRPIDDTAARWFACSGLDETTLPAFRDRIVRYEQSSPQEHGPRGYPGYPRIELPRSRPRLGVRLDATLAERRCARALRREQASQRELGRIPQYAHAVCGEGERGPTPSAGNLQALELYLEAGWLQPAAYHYDRAGHHLSTLRPPSPRRDWESLLPSARQFDGGAILWVIVGDTSRPIAKYGARALRFLLLEAGNLMQNLCLASQSEGLCTRPRTTRTGPGRWRVRPRRGAPFSCPWRRCSGQGCASHRGHDRRWQSRRESPRSRPAPSWRTGDRRGARNRSARSGPWTVRCRATGRRYRGAAPRRRRSRPRRCTDRS